VKGRRAGCGGESSRPGESGNGEEKGTADPPAIALGAKNKGNLPACGKIAPYRSTSIKDRNEVLGTVAP